MNEEKTKKKFNKKLLTFGIIGLFALALVTGALLTYYGVITGQAQVKQSLIVELGNVNCLDSICTYDIGDSPAYPGSTYVEQIKLTNRANRQVPIEFVTIVNKCEGPESTGCKYRTCEPDNSNVISTRYLGELILENKERIGWQPILGDGIQATLKYDLVSPTFDYELEATGLQVNTQYVLIYYADRQDRFVNWGGDNPGKLIATVTSDENGYVLITGSGELNTDLPHTDDWNLAPTDTDDADEIPDDYCNDHNGFDSFNLCSGAKIWLVPKVNYDSGTKKVNWADPNSYLFETDMIDYSDSDKGGDTFNMNPGFIDVSIENTFNLATETGCYQIRTEIVPLNL